MYRKMIFFVIVAILLFGVSACGVPCDPPTVDSIPITLYPQHRDWWCWAASAEMVTENIGHRVLQPDSANFVHGQPPDCWVGCDCWGQPWGATVQEIKDNFDHWNIDYTYVSSSLGWDELKEVISGSLNCLNSPIYVWLSPGHIVVVHSYIDTTAENYIAYQDPWPPDFIQTANVANPCPPTNGGATKLSTYTAFESDWLYSWYDFSYVNPEESD